MRRVISMPGAIIARVGHACRFRFGRKLTSKHSRIRYCSRTGCCWNEAGPLCFVRSLIGIASAYAIVRPFAAILTSCLAWLAECLWNRRQRQPTGSLDPCHSHSH